MSAFRTVLSSLRTMVKNMEMNKQKSVLGDLDHDLNTSYRLTNAATVSVECAKYSSPNISRVSNRGPLEKDPEHVRCEQDS